MKQNYTIVDNRITYSRYFDKNGSQTANLPYTRQYGSSSFNHKGSKSPRGKDGRLLLRANPYERTTTNYQNSVFHIRYEQSSGAYQDEFRSVTVQNPLVVKDQQLLVDETTQRAMKDFKNKCANLNANFALTIAERREILQTLSTLTYSFYKKSKKIIKDYDQIRKITNERRKARRIKQIISGTSVPGMSKAKDKMADFWLFGIYGVAPVISDIQTAIDHVKMADLKRLHGRARTTFPTESKTSTFNSVLEFSQWLDGFVSVHVNAQVKVTDPLLKMLAEMGFTNPLLIGWERVKYSFLIDWVINVGDWLQGLSFDHGIAITDINVTTTIRKGLTSGSYTFKNALGTKNSGTLVQSCNWKYEHKKRTLLTSIPNDLTFGSNVSLAKIVTSIALSNQRLASLRR